MTSIIFEEDTENILTILQKCDEITPDIIKLLKSLNKEDFTGVINKLSEAYYHKTPLVSDEFFDIIENIYDSRFPKEKKKIGSKDSLSRPSGSKVLKVKLPYPMFSLDKVKDEKSLNLWKKKYPNSEFYFDDKLDGVSACYYRSKKGSGQQSRFQLFKRGDETEGSDITYLLEFLNIPDHEYIPEGFAVRGEIVISLKNFSKYESVMKNPRNMVAGLTNSKTIDTKMIKDLDFVAYQIFSDTSLSKKQQIDTLIDLGFKTAYGNELDEKDLEVESLTELTKYRKRKSEYDIDGIVLSINETNIKFPIDSNPKHQVAFKIEGDTAITTVNFIEWNISKQGYYKPRINVEPVNLSGATLTWFTGNNARFVVDNGIGKNAKIVVTRSGGVIPKILEVLERAEPELPEDAEWNENKVELVVQDTENEEQYIQKIVSFFSTLKAKFMAETTIRKIYESGFTTLKDFFNLDQEDLIKIEGFKEKSADRIIDSIQGCIKNVQLYEIMAASSYFMGFGSKRLKLITQEIPDLIDIKDEDELDNIREQVLSIKGFKTLADVFVNNLIKFNEWLLDHPQITIAEDIDNSDNEKNSDQESDNNVSFDGETFVFSGVRSVLLEKEILRRGGRVTTGVSKKTTIVLVKTSDFTSSKIETARINGAKILVMSEFANKYGLQYE